MAKLSLSKSTFIKGVQCLKALYLYKNRYFLRDRLSDEQLSKFRRGHAVGHLAQDLFPGGVNLAPSSPSQHKKALEATLKAVNEGESIIYEAAFKYKETIIFLDILVRDDGGWKAYEVKSSLSLSETYLQDAALQYNVLRGAGLNIIDFCLIHVKSDYVFKDSLDIESYFVKVTVLDDIRKMQPWVEQMREKAFEAIALPHSPDIDIGEYCNKPYPCDFRGHCWKNIPNKSVFELSLLPEELRFALYYSGRVSAAELLPGNDLNDAQRRQLYSLVNNVTMSDNEGITDIDKKILSPVFLSVFGLKPAVPILNECSPFEFVPVLWHCSSNGKIVCIKADQADPYKHFYEYLRGLTLANTLIVYDDSEIKSCLQHIIKLDKNESETVQRIGENLISMRWIIEEGQWCNPNLIPPLTPDELISKVLLRRLKISRAGLAIAFSKESVPLSVYGEVLDEAKQFNMLYLSSILKLYFMIFPQMEK